MADDKRKDPDEEEFTLALDEYKFRVKDPKSGESTAYLMRELGSKARDMYLNVMKGRTRVTDGVATVTDFEGLQSKLLSKCIYRAEDEQLEDEATIQNWPSRMQTSLYKRALKMSGLGKDAEDDAKNG